MLFVKPYYTSVRRFCFSEKTDIFYVELNLRRQKWLIFCCYNPHKHLIKDHLLQTKNVSIFILKAIDFILQNMFQSLHTSLPVVHIKSTVNIEIIKGLLQCYSIVKNSFLKLLFDIFHDNKYKHNE